MAKGALSFDIESNVSNFSRAMALVESTAKQKAASFALEFTGAGKKVDTALSSVGTRAITQISDGLSGAAKRFEADFSKASANVNRDLLKGLGGVSRPAMLGAAGSIAPLVAGLAGLAVGYLAVKTAIDQANDQVEKFIKLGADSSRAGVSVDFWQRFTEAAEKAKVATEEVEAALKRAGEAVTPRFEQEDGIRKRLNELFESGYLGSFQSKGLADYNAAGTNEERIRAAVTAMQELMSLGDRLAALDIAEKLFGNEVADRIRRGKLDIEEIARSLDRPRDDLVTAEEVQRAEELRQRLSEAYSEIDKALGVSVNLTGAGRDLQDVWLAIAEAVAAASKAADGLLSKLAEAKQGSSDLMGQIATALGAQAVNRALFPNQGKTLYSADDPAGPPAPIAPPTPPRRPLSIVLDEQAVRAPARGGSGRAPSKATESLDQVETYINGIERSTEALKAEADAIGKSAAERQSAINVARLEAVARQQGITLTADQIAKVKDLSKATVEYKDAIEEARDRQEALRSIGGDVLKGIASDAKNGASALDILTNAVSRLADRLSDKALDSLADSLFGKSGSSGGSGLMGSLFGGSGGAGEAVKGLNLASLFGASPLPSFAAGVTSAGIIEGPGTGTSDSILARVSRGESIVTAKATSAHRGLIEAMNAGKLPAFAGGRIPDPAEFGAAMESASRAGAAGQPAPRLSPAAADRAAVGMTTEVNVIGGEKTSATTSMGPRGPRTEITIDKAVAAALMGGANTRSALKQIGGGRLTGK